jgi:multiple sugar transport system ATP-binding protein
VDVVEFLGNDELLHLSAGGSELVVFVPSAQGVKVDQNVTLHVPVEKVHLFDPDSGLTLTAKAQ